MNRRKRVFDLVVNPLICNNLTPLDEVSIAKDIPIKYLPYFKEVFAHKNANKIRYRYRGPSTLTYKRDPSYIHMNNADRFTLYYR
jgi:hypothetical protein|tara:strand:- start:560 stop:814 length:255 start_codon:yes stop_codon:yes gene_type:complete